ncbi:MAG: methionine/alanine import family NSS transporter small subunit [Propionibacteriaceae bacterium]|jgi:hypothetical protein|nr:methionine/alanine import family NSS transporter small subunit [Propionibacteriaceae bacterium]
MSGSAIAMLIVSIVVIWGGLAASGIFLATHKEVDHYPPGAPEH